MSEVLGFSRGTKDNDIKHTSPVEPKDIFGGQRHGRTVSLVTILTFMVSALGYVREATLASRFGVSPIMDAYFGAILIPYTLYFIVVVGTLSPVFIPILLQDGPEFDSEKASEAFSVVLNFTLMFMTAVVVFSLATARYWVPWLFPGFNPPTAAMLLRLVYIVYPAVIFLALGGILTAALNGFHKFALAAIVPAISSLIIIAAALLARGPDAIYVVGAATTFGFVIQFLVLLPRIPTLKIQYRAIFSFRHPALIKMLRLGGPLFLYLLASNASSIIERNLASRIATGAVSAMTYAMRLFTVPANFLAAPLAVVSYPLFAREAVRKNRGNLRIQLTGTLRFVVIIFVPVTLLLILNALPVTRLLYERGEFHARDSALISSILALYGFGVLPNAVAIILLRCFFAIQDTVTPLAVEMINLVLYAASATWLARNFGIPGLAAAKALSFFIVTAIFLLTLWKKAKLLNLDFDFFSLFVRTAAASTVMGAVNWFTLRAMQHLFDSGNTSQRFFVLGVVLVVSSATFLGVARLLKLDEPYMIIKTIFRVVPLNRNA